MVGEVEFCVTPAAHPAGLDWTQSIFVLPVDCDFTPAARCRTNAAEMNGANAAAAVLSPQQRGLKMPLIHGDGTGVLGESLSEVFERLHQRIGLPAGGHGLLAR